jgi:acyl transferase domain-containing protein/NAD(P)-dependent dehydrogenase (short-subunit alcohol dehydrogenase family)/acyl carrier protein
MEATDVIVLSPAGVCNPAPAIAACRAGARGFLDLEFAGDNSASANSIQQLARFAPSGFGLKLQPGFALPAGIRPKWIIVAGGDFTCIPKLRETGAELLAEAVNVAEAERAVATGVDGLILKGLEAGGRVGSETSFVLIQKWQQLAEKKKLAIPFWVQGGIGAHTAAACIAGGARGVVLDSQVLLAKESPLDDAERKRVAGLDGSETQIVGGIYRTFSRGEAAQELAAYAGSDWRGAVQKAVANGLPLYGQDVATAAALAAKGVTVSGIVRHIVDTANAHLNAAKRSNHLAAGSALAVSHGTKYPILQGPMTRVSDTAAFADSVAAGGALPFLALALLRKAETDQLLAETKAKLGKKPWGVGILGFVPNEIRSEQLEGIRKYKPPFAIIAGGRPDQAKELEAIGIPTYLHVPSPGLLRMFLKDSAKRFIFEGMECGGHVGPRASFALWESMVEVLAEHKPADGLHVVFAGGIHDALSASMVAALSAGLAAKGVKVGVLLGTAYLFTKEAVAGGAITARFQKEALACGETLLLETGPGHAIRVIPTPYADTFEAEKKKLKAEGKSHMDVGLALERMNLGRLRVASKGVDRVPSSNGLAPIGEDDQFQRGMYMIGQVAALRSDVTTIAELHEDVCRGPELLAKSPIIELAPSEPPAPPPCDVAIVGLSCFYPNANGLWNYWENILAKTNAVVEIPQSHWDWRLYYDADPRARDKMVSKWGGFMGDIPFDPLKYGITPKSIPNIEPLQLLLLEAVNQAIGDAGYLDRPFNRERTCAILGVGGGGMPLSVAYGFRACMPLLDSIPGVKFNGQSVIDAGEGILPEWTEDSFPGILLNVAAGRVSNRFNLGGPNMAIDAACGSSLAALYAGVRELNDGTSDVAIVMGGDAVQTPYAYVAFSKTHALSPKGRCRPFDAEADGIALAEGVGVAVLKRLADAERDGDRIYAVIKGVGASSDGRDKGLTAPRAEGQLRALHRAYAQARLNPANVALVEAHGTGTVVGDQTEARAIGTLFRDAGGELQSCALGSVKSMIGHSKCAAGLAGLIKTAFALHHKVLPPTLATTPNPKANLDGGPLYLNTEARPWIHGAEHPRTAGVSAFGFGGTNFHTVLEEYTGDYLNRPETGMRTWPAELFVWRRPDAAAITASVKHVQGAIAAGATPTLADLAASVWNASKNASGSVLAVVATSLTDLKEKLDAALQLMTKGEAASDPRGIFFTPKAAPTGKVAFLFPGQGSQYPDMLAQAAIAFAEVRETIDAADRTLAADLERSLGKLIYPPSPFTPEQEAANREAIRRTEHAQPALGAVGLGMFKLLSSLGIEADMFAGHSYGEFAALAAAGAMSEADLFRLSHRRGKAVKDASSGAPGGMLALDATPETLAPILKGNTEAWVANHNSPRQTVIAGTEKGLKLAEEKLQAANIRSQRIPVACGFHSPLIAAAKPALVAALAEANITAPKKPVWSNTSAAPHPADGTAIAKQLAEHLVSSVRFADEIAAMHAAGARIFVEVGPQAVLTNLTSQILADKPHLAVATDAKSRPGLVQLAHMLGQLLAAGVPANLDRLFQGRAVQAFDLAKLDANTGKPKHTPTTWVVNGVRSRPLNGPEPRLLGQTFWKDEAKPAAKPQAAREAPAPTPSKPAVAAAPAPKPDVPKPVPSAPKPQSVAPRVMMNTTETQPAQYVPSANGTPLRTGPVPEGAEQVMARFQDVMARFLDTQKSVMLSYLGSGGTLPSNGSNSFHAVPLPAPAPVNRIAVVEQSAPRPVVAPSVVPVAKTAPAPAVVAPPVEANGKHVEPAAPVAAKPAASPKLDRDTLLARLLDLVSERTGYPKEALSIDLDLEADLGVDSIKRVEVLGALAESIEAASDGSQPNLEMEKLSVIKTLRGIADYVMEALDSAGPAAAPEPSANGKHERVDAKEQHPGAREGDVQRLVVRLIDAPLPMRPVFAPPSGTVVITDDKQGTARELADRLGELDIKTAIVSHGTDADLTDPAAVADLIARIHAKHGPVSALIHLLPLAEPPAGESDEARMQREVKSLYLLARGLEADLREAGKAGSASLLAVTAMGGTMGFGGDLPVDFFPGHGGIAGFAKCLGHEWPEVAVRIVDVDGSTPAPRMVELLMSELGDPKGPLEVGRDGDRRVTWQVEPGPLAADVPEVSLKPGETVLITGGARGITAKIALELATRHQPKLVLVGSSPVPAEESADTAGLSTQAEIKAALMKRPDAKPAAVEAAYKRLSKDREIRANLAAIRAAGSTVDYRSIDVRDAAAFGGLIDELNASGGIAGVIHGAGVIEDKLLRDKTPESFDRVFGTKVESALTLRRKLDPAKLKFFSLYASITSRYGNRGQSDYACANEVLSKMACDLDRKWPGRVVAIAWGPWSEVGMVADLEKHLTARGLKLIEPAVGANFAIDEVIFGSKGEPEVLVAGGSERTAAASTKATTEAPLAAGVN